MNRCRLIIILFVCSFFISLHPLISQSASSIKGQSLEEVKSAFILNFIKFIKWPENSMDSPNRTFCIGMIGRDPIKKTLQLYENDFVKGHRIMFRQFQKLEDINNCHVLYISPSIKDRTPEIVKHIKGRSILTISHYEGFDEDGGIIDFVIRDNKFQFIINNETAKAENLKISSKLLNLAIISNSKSSEFD